MRGLHYCLCKGKAWINMPSKKGMLNGEPCAYPICNWKNRESQRAFVGLIQILFSAFVRSPQYTSLDKHEREEKSKRARSNMVFIHLPSKKKM